MALRIYFLTYLLIFILSPFLQAQGDCAISIGSIYGASNSYERGYSLVATPGNDGYYVGGLREDSVLIIKSDLDGNIEWARTFDIVPGEEDHICVIFLDSDGMLALAGIAGDPGLGGSVFAFRYNPNTNQIVWANEYISTTPRNYAFSMIQKGSGGNYILTNNPHEISVSNNDCEILEINKDDGNILPSFSKNYHLGSSEGLADLVFTGSFIYGAGRYTDGPATGDMRHTIVKINPSNGSQVWVKMGHVPSHLNARLYGFDLVIDQNEIYSGYYGDPVSSSTTNTKLYLQKTDLNGNLIWLKQYELPGNNDVGIEIIKSGSGFVVLAGKRASPSELILFKIDADGIVLWAKLFQFPAIINNIGNLDSRVSQLIEVGGKLVFTAFSTTPAGGSNMVIVRTNLEGEVDIPCVTNQPVSIAVLTISNPTFYTVNPNAFNVTLNEDSQFPEPIDTDIAPREECYITDTLFSFISATICAGDEYQGYSIEGSYVDYFTTSQGCDSARTLDLEINEPAASSEQIQICLGQSYGGYSVSGIYLDTFQNILGCDSIHSLNLNVVALVISLAIQICTGEQYDGYTTSGLYLDTLQGVFSACDTVRYLNLTVYPIDQSFISATICDGDEYEGHSNPGEYVDFFTNSMGCDSIRVLDLHVENNDFTEEAVTICLGESYGGYSEAGIYLDTFQNLLGCDSFHTLTLDVVALEINLSVSICEGESYEGYLEQGFYVDTLQGISNSCDTIRFLQIIQYVVDETYITAAICSGNNYQGYTASGQYIDVFENINGCDSVRTINLTVSDEIYTNISVTICPGESYEGYSAEGIYVDQFVTMFGCDSIRTLELTIGIPETYLAVSLCAGGQFENYSEAGEYTDIIPGENGDCDILRHLTISIIPPFQIFIYQSICSGESYFGYTATGTYIDTLLTQAGCDSIRTIELTIIDEIHTDESIVICPGDMYEGYSVTGTYIDTFNSIFGCDSIRSLNLALTAPEKFIDVMICEGGQFENYNQAGTYIDTLPGKGGACDTIRHLIVEITSALETYISHSICEGQLFLGYATTGLYTDTFSTILGCDSIRILDLSVSDVIHHNLNLIICNGDSYEGYTVGGIYLDTFVSAFGCDSIRILELSVLPAMMTSIEHTICAGQNYEGYTTSGVYTDRYLSDKGCDSVRTLYLTSIDQVRSHVNANICEGAILGHSKSGIYIDTLVSYAGCDSIRTLAIGSGDKYIPNVFSPNDDGINDNFRIFQFPEDALDLQYFGIFDRLGDMVYQTEDWPVIWNGKRLNGEPFQPAVFAYVLIYECGDNRIVEHGNITLIK